MSGILAVIAILGGAAVAAGVWAFRRRDRRQASGMRADEPTRPEEGEG